MMFESVSIIVIHGNKIQKSIEMTDSYFITRGQYVVYKFTITKRKYYSSNLSGIFGFEDDSEAVYVDMDINQIYQVSNAFYTGLNVQPKTKFIRYEEERFQYTGIHDFLLFKVYLLLVIKKN